MLRLATSSRPLSPSVPSPLRPTLLQCRALLSTSSSDDTAGFKAADGQRLNRYSAVITQSKARGASQAMLYATGLTEADMDRPQVGIASMWWEGNPCNMHLLDLARDVKKGVTAADLVGLCFNTIGVSDGISMGTDGMSYSLQSRELIADSIETVMGGQWYDGNICIPGCDKNMPGCVIAMARVNRPSLMVYGGTIRAGCS
uniref:Dihydroxy-acid/6-phosphogluconate dehydratase N-terminal domain-containing protein n=1 Tax=Peronospora matthiolae TaxID=2874970 RepID=A0AAV1UDR9_9STRA